MSTQKTEQKIEELRSCLNETISAEALCELSALLDYSTVPEQYYELASTGIINSLKSSKLKESVLWSDNDRLSCYRKLLNQEKLTTLRHVFLHTVAQHQSTGEDWVIPAIAKAFDPILRDLHASKKLNKNAILCLMMVREHIGSWITQAEISALHLDIFHTLNVEDISLPYSSLFQRSVYNKNIDDLNALINNTTELSNLKLYQLVYVLWLFSNGTQYPYKNNSLIELISEKISSKNSPVHDLELASAKTLLAHHASDMNSIEYSKLEQLLNEIDPGNTFSELLNHVSNNQTQIKKSLNNKDTKALTKKLQKKTYQGLHSGKNIIAGHTGITFPFRKKLKVAVCISGQLRGYKKAFDSWGKSILAGLDYDIYVHSWESIGGSGAEPFRKILPFTSNAFKDAYREYCLTLSFENIQLEYPTLFKYLKQSNNTTTEEVSTYYNAKKVVLESEKAPKFDDFSNSDKMHYKLHACDQLVQESGKKYDLILRIRPDFLISFTAFNWRHIYDICHSQPVIFSDLPFGTNYMSCMVGDQLAVGSPETIGVYANTWGLYPNLAENGLLKCGNNLIGHESIAMNCWIHKIEFEKLPLKKGGLVEASAMSSALIYEAISIDAKGRNSFWDEKFLTILKKDSTS
jgi:hypothetical protein